VDLFGRTDVNADEVRQNPDDPDDVQTQRSLDDAHETEAAGFAKVRWSWGPATLETGGRLTWLEQGNAGDSTLDDTAWSGFLGFSVPLDNHVRLQGSLSTGVRFPSLTERYFTGTTGRGAVLGNPDLDPERSFNAELSLRWLSQRLLVEGAVYRNRIDQYIERIEVAPDLLTWVNVSSGVIRGVDFSGTFRPVERWQVDFGGQYVQGEDDDDRPLSDIPPAELFAGGGYASGPWRVTIRLAHRFEKTDIGSGEKPIPAAQLLQASIAYRLTPRWNLALVGENLLGEEYFRSADRKAPLAQGRSVGMQFRWSE
jgi:iron complex outermembrane receptor protein